MGRSLECFGIIAQRTPFVKGYFLSIPAFLQHYN
jgi:hypothetical protein